VASKKKALAQQFSLPLQETRISPFDARRIPAPLSELKRASLRSPAPYAYAHLALPTPSPVFTSYWKFAKARQDLFFARHTGSSFETRDPILKTYRFTNVYRASDRVSQYLIRHVLYNGQWSANNILFRLLLFKFFNKIETWEALQSSAGIISWETYDFGRYDKCLTELMESDHKIYSAAYIMPSGQTAFGYKRKHRNHLKIIEKIILDCLSDRISECETLEALFCLLRKYPCIGPFIGYQLAVDLNYSPLVDFSEDEFVQPGPGALDGITKCFFDLGDLKPADVIRYATDIQEDAFMKGGLTFQTLWGRRLHLIDTQNLFCEISKYARIAHPEFDGTSSRKRIKQIYRPLQRPLEAPWFPPKWGLNSLVASDSRRPAR
jgi:hypothetical protein